MTPAKPQPGKNMSDTKVRKRHEAIVFLGFVASWCCFVVLLGRVVLMCCVDVLPCFAYASLTARKVTMLGNAGGLSNSVSDS